MNPTTKAGVTPNRETPIGDPTQPPLRPSKTTLSARDILIVLGIIAGLTAIVLPNFQRTHCGGTLTACKSNCKNLATALEMYASDNAGFYPDKLSDLLPGKYLKVLPTCPATQAMSYSDYAADGKNNFSFSCVGNNHAEAYTGFRRPSDNYPQYSAEQGMLDHP